MHDMCAYNVYVYVYMHVLLEFKKGENQCCIPLSFKYHNIVIFFKCSENLSKWLVEYIFFVTFPLMDIVTIVFILHVTNRN